MMLGYAVETYGEKKSAMFLPRCYGLRRRDGSRVRIKDAASDRCL